MRSKSAVSGLLVLAIGVAGCGSSSSSSASKKSGAKKTTSRPSRTYTVDLKGPAETPAGAPGGGGTAIVALHDSTHQVCWRFAHLHGFSHATFAHIHMGPPGKSGNIVVPLSTSGTLHHKGCVTASPSVIGAIEKDPKAYYVNIHSKQYPGGAVRAQL